MNHSSLETFRRLISGFAPNIGLWIADESGLMLDPYETEDAENYSPAPSAYILAQVVRWSGLPVPLEQAFRLMNRVAEILRGRVNSTSDRVLIRFHGLLAYGELSMQAPGSERNRWAEALSVREDNPSVSTEAAALRVGTELLGYHIGLWNSDIKQAKADLELIAGRQQKRGFINNDLHEGAMPISGHLRILSYLSAAVSVVRQSKDSSVHEVIREADEIFSQGFSWLLRFITPDGLPAMAGQGSLGTSVLGDLLSVLAYAGLGPDSDPVLDALAGWFPYRQEDGTFFPVRNFFNAVLRVGYEPEVRFAGANALAFAGICRAVRLWEGEQEGDAVLYAGSPQRPEGRRIEAVIREDGPWIDQDSGYARLRSAEHYLALTLRHHAGSNVPAWQPFGVRLGGGRFSPLPEPAFRREAPFESVWEGFALQDKEQWLVPDWTVNPTVQLQNGGLEMTVEAPDFTARKWIGFVSDRLKVEYEVTAHRDFGACRGVWPVLLSTGREDAVLPIAGEMMALEFSGETFSIACPEGFFWRLGLPRMFLSPSGGTALACLIAAPYLPKGTTARWSVVVEREFE